METDRPLLDAATSAQPHMPDALRALLDRVKRRSGLGLPAWAARPVSMPDIVPDGGKFIEAPTATRREAVLTSSTSPAAIRGRRSLWSSCCTAALSRRTISPPARA